MARLPSVGGDIGNWGQILNDYLSVEHNADGTLKAFFDVKAYGAKGDGSTDDTTAINNAIAAATSGGIVLFPPGVYKTTGTINLSMHGVQLVGAGGFGSWATIAPSNGAVDVISITANDCGVNNLTIDPSVTMTAGSAINIANARNARIIRIFNNNTALLWRFLTAINCDKPMISDVYATARATDYGIYVNNCPLIVLNDVDIASGDTTKQQICFAFISTASILARNITQNGWTNARQAFFIQKCNDSTFYSLSNNGTTDAALSVDSSADIHFFTPYFYYGAQSTGHNVIITNSSTINFMGGQSTGSAVGDGFNISGSHDIRITGTEILLNHGAGVHVTGSCYGIGVANCSIHDMTGVGIVDASTDYPSADSYVGNTFYKNAGGNVSYNGTGAIFSANPGYNPRGLLNSQPSLPASGATYTNNTGGECQVYISGGTVTSISINGSVTGLTSGMVVVGISQTIAITYTYAPSWKWFGN